MTDLPKIFLNWLKRLKRFAFPDQPPIGASFPVVMWSELSEEHFSGGSRGTGRNSTNFHAFVTSSKPSNKWSQYFDIYDECLLPLRDWLHAGNETPGILEIGTAYGGSLIAWRSVFGERSFVCGLDIDPKEQEFNDPQIQIVKGSQTDETALKAAVAHLPKLHLVIDDGSHVGVDQKASFVFLWQHLQPGGLYLVEDLHTSYWRSYEGGLMRRRKTGFIEYAKHLVDVQHDHYSSRQFGKNEEVLRDSIFSVTFFDSIVAVRKANLPTTRFRVSNMKEPG